MDWLKDAELGRHIPGFFPAREAAWEAGAMNVGLIGQQPSLMILAEHTDALQRAVAAATDAFAAHTTRVSTLFSALRAPRPDRGPTGDSDG
jgi:homoserine kinase